MCDLKNIKYFLVFGTERFTSWIIEGLYSIKIHFVVPQKRFKAFTIHVFAVHLQTILMTTD